MSFKISQQNVCVPQPCYDYFWYLDRSYNDDKIVKNNKSKPKIETTKDIQNNIYNNSDYKNQEEKSSGSSEKGIFFLNLLANSLIEENSNNFQNIVSNNSDNFHTNLLRQFCPKNNQIAASGSASASEECKCIL